MKTGQEIDPDLALAFQDLREIKGGALDLYLTFDGFAFGTNPLADVATIGRFAGSTL